MFSDSDYTMPKAKGDTAIPRFHIGSKLNKFKTAQQGREVWDDVELVEVLIPGDNKNQPVFEVNETYKARWPQQYARWKEGLEYVGDGLPLEKWTLVSPGQVKNLAQFNIRTVEQLAAVPESQLQNIMGGYKLQKQAKIFLAQAESNSGISQVVAENESLKLEIDHLKEQMRDLAARMPKDGEAPASAPSQVATPDIAAMVAEQVAQALKNAAPAPVKRKRRTKAEMEADKAAEQSSAG